MQYPRPPYKDPTITTEKVTALFSSVQNEIPLFETPISIKENFYRAAKRQSPLWAPASSTTLQSLLTHDVAGASPKPGIMQIHSDLKRPAPEDYFFEDWFGTSWTFVKSAGGAMLTPGTKFLSDITKWEKEIIWPKFSDWGFEEKAAEYMRDTYNPDKVMHYDLGRGVTERLVSLLGGYTDSMEALALEPEAVLDFFNVYIDFMIEFFDLINSLYPLGMVTLHDDWGTERDTFFSERMMEELVYEPTKRFIDHVKSKDVIFEMHACGNVTRFVPYMIDMGVDFMQIQRRAVDIPALKKKYGDKIGFNASLEGMEFGKKYNDEEIAKLVRDSVDIYAPYGGCYFGMFMPDPKDLWTALAELFAYSREFYDKEQGR